MIFLVYIEDYNLGGFFPLMKSWKLCCKPEAEHVATMNQGAQGGW